MFYKIRNLATLQNKPSIKLAFFLFRIKGNQPFELSLFCLNGSIK